MTMAPFPELHHWEAQRLYPRIIANHEKKLVLGHFHPYEHSPQNLVREDDYDTVMTQTVIAAWYMRNVIDTCVDAVLLMKQLF